MQAQEQSAGEYKNHLQKPFAGMVAQRGRAIEFAIAVMCGVKAPEQGRVMQRAMGPIM